MRCLAKLGFGPLVVCAALLAAPGAHAASAQQAITQLNAQRAANGIPAGITENPTWSSDCAKHDHYMAVNGTLTHQEVMGGPGYTPEGAYAGQNAVIGQGLSWDNGNPYESAPLHLDQLLAPRLLSTGSADAEGFTCTTTFPGWTRADPASLTVYTYPGNGAKIYPSETARELPKTPGELAGLPAGATTGPNLIVLVDAPGQPPADNPATLSSASLAGPSGAVAVRTIDGSGPDPNGGSLSLGAYISPGGFIIPVSPLTPGVTYEAHVVIGFAGVQTPYDWSFTTTAVAPQARFTIKGSRLSFRSRSRVPLGVSFRRLGGGHAKSLRITPGSSVNLPRLSLGRWTVCGHENAGGLYAAYDHCFTITVGHVPTLALGPPRTRNGTVSFVLHFSAVLRGRIARLSVTKLNVLSCTNGHCPTSDGTTARSRLTLRAGSISFALPAANHGLRVLLSTAAFRVGRTKWSSAQAIASYSRP